MKFHEFINEDYESITDDEILREAIQDEYRAANLYEKMARRVSSSKVRRVLLDIANEEKVHIGEFEALLEEIDDDHYESTEEGYEEVEEI
jgi:rubrerythrin